MKKLIYLVVAIAIMGCEGAKNVPQNFDFGKTENGLYSNDFFEMTISFDPSWSVQSEQQVNNMVEQGSELIDNGNEELGKVVKASQVNTAYLLTVFKHERGAPVEFNSSFLVVAENTKNAPGIKTGADYLFHAKQILEQTGMNYTYSEGFEEKQIGSQLFHCLVATIDVNGMKVTQEYYATVKQGFSLSFILSYNDEEQKNELYGVIDNMKI